MAKVIKVPIHLDAIVVDKRSAKTVSGSNDGWAPAIVAGNPDALFQSAPLGLEVGVHLHWALPDALCQAHESVDGQRTEFFSVPDLWLVIRYLPPAKDGQAKRRLVVWAVDSISGRKYVLQGPSESTTQLPSTPVFEYPLGMRAGGKQVTISAADKKVLSSVMSQAKTKATLEAQASPQAVQLIAQAQANDWQLAPGSQSVIESLLEQLRGEGSLGTPIDSLAKVIEQRDDRPERLTASGFQDRNTGEFPEPAPAEAAPGPMWAAYYPNARNRFGIHDSLSDLEQGEGPVSYMVVGWYHDPDEDPLYAAGTASARRQLLEAFNWTYREPKGQTLPELFEQMPQIEDLREYITEIEELVHEINPDDLLDELINPGPGGGLPDEYDPLPGGVFDDVPELPTDVFNQPDIGLRHRQPDIVRVGAEGFDLAIGQGRALTQQLAARTEQLDAASTRTRAATTTKSGPKLLGGTTTLNKAASLRSAKLAAMAGSKAKLVRDRQALLMRRAQQQRLRERATDVVVATPSKQTTTSTARTELAVDRKLATSSRAAAVSKLVTRASQGSLVAGISQHELLGALADTNLGIERDSSLLDIVPGQLMRTPAPSRIVCHGAVLGVGVKGSEGIYVGASLGIIDEGESSEAVLGSSYASAIADELSQDYSGSTSAKKAVLEALHAGLQSRLSSASGAERLPQLLHQDSFDPSHVDDDGPRTRKLVLVPALLEGEPVAIPADAERPGVGLAVDQSEDRSRWLGGDEPVDLVEMRPAAEGQRVAMRYLGQITAGQAIAGTSPSALVVKQQWDAREQRIVEDPAIRWWRPADPIVLLEGASRGLRHGKDGRFDPDGRLSCRLSGQGVDVNDISLLWSYFLPQDGAVREPIRGEDLVFTGPFLAQLGEELRPAIDELVSETALLDPTNKRRMSKVWTSSASAKVAPDDVFETHCEMWRTRSHPNVDDEAIDALLGFGKDLPSPIAIKFNDRVWSPIIAEYEAKFEAASGRDQNLTDNWVLGDVEHELIPSHANILSNDKSRTYEGRAFPTPAAAETMAEAIRDAASGDQELAAKAETVAQHLRQLDVLGFSIPDIDETAATEASTHAGRLRLTRVRVVDTFGQTHKFERKKVAHDDWAPGSRRNDAAEQRMLLRPRLPYLAKLHFRFMDAETLPKADPEDARPWLSPICGYLLPDHIEHAIEVFDNRGRALGQIRHRGKFGLSEADIANKQDLYVVWDPAPGVEPRLGDEAASIDNPFLRGVIRGILRYNKAIADAALTGAPAPDESALSAMIRAIDTVQDTVDRKVGRNEFIATLVGRPVAVVRARARLEIRPPAEMTTRPRGIEARLGSLTQFEDGLFGYYEIKNKIQAEAKGDTDIDVEDFMHFHPPHDAVLTHARPRLGSADVEATTQPITHDFIQNDPTVDLAPSEDVELVLLMDPHAGVHATTGLLPRKRIMLDRTQYEDALGRIAPTFKVGPVLLDPKTKAMPVPGLERFDWAWTRREQPASGPDGWSVSEVGTLPDSAVLPTQPLELHEGWLRLLADEESAAS
ncbi:hypothetical protein G6O69_22270 [Pseudenhygromyxa sp. WMMC2535]|uniref:hypothetical protein n=1 Tax=Pseudenhygromyxa sp. WMMC2535 TaxID=2712867 RepID=UPI001553A257|nr:hypothetical protein [Pseudenhygromyxa sp. WMMC2535]NVB40583.1 hypothetical protein [Pseudenhygromyxa sp. WMMC2535]